MDKKIILSLLVVALIGIVAATYQINNGVDILNPLSNVEIEDTPVTDTLEAPAEAAANPADIASDNQQNQQNQKPSDTEVENSEPINTTASQQNTTGNDPNANNPANNDSASTSNATSDSNASSGSDTPSNATPSTSAGSSSGPGITLDAAGDTSNVVEGQGGSGSSSNDAPTTRVTPQTDNSANANPSDDTQTDNADNTTDNQDDEEITIESARSIVEQAILEKWSGNEVTLSYGTTLINDDGDKCYIYNLINNDGVQEGQASYNLRTHEVDIMDNSGVSYA